MKQNILVEGTNWNVAGVNTNHANEKHFVDAHMKDAGTYKDLDAEKKEKALKLVYKLVKENTPSATNPAPPTPPAPERPEPRN